ncbi:MAG TPA: 50S ribosomal protein L19 [Candidatus Magasanikbacteria bacterium]|nr:50S ribosomal protein L19 [Candidatus Magasanikbacteria bacterium]
MSDDIRHDLKPGMVVRVHQKIKETNTKGEEKERIQVYEGTILAVKHGTAVGATVTVRKISEGVGVEKIFPINSPVVAKIEFVRQLDVKRARPYFIRDYKKKIKEVVMKGMTATETEKTDK